MCDNCKRCITLNTLSSPLIDLHSGRFFLKSFCSEMNCSCVTGFSSSAGELQLHCLHNWIGIRQRRLSAGKIKRIVSVTNVWLERRFSWLASDWHLWPHASLHVWQLWMFCHNDLILFNASFGVWHYKEDLILCSLDLGEYSSDWHLWPH